MNQRRSTQLFKIKTEQQTPLITDLSPEVRYLSYGGSFASAIFIALSGIFIGFALSQTTPIKPTTYEKYWNLSFSGQTCQILMIGLPSITAIIGASLTKATLAHLSRKSSLVIGSIALIVTSIIMLIPEQQTLLIGRLLQGVAIGFEMGITTIYLRQVSPKELRAQIMPLVAVGVTGGSVICYFISYMMVLADFSAIGQARVLLIFNGVLAILQLVGCLTIVPHSPHERIGKGFLEQGKAILGTIYKQQYVQQEFEDIKKDLESAKKAADANQINASQRDPQQLKLTQKADKARAVAIFIGLYRQLNGGIPLLTFLGPVIQVIQSGSGKGLSNYAPLVVTVIAFVGNVVGVFTISKYVGRKPLLIISSISMLITNVVLGAMLQIRSQWVFFGFCILQMIFYGFFSLAPGWTYPNQVVSPDRVALQNGLTALGLAVAIFLSPILVNFIPSHLGYPIYYFAALWNLVGIFIYSCILVESKGLTYHQIIEKY